VNQPARRLERLGGGRRPVAPSAVEDELGRLWRQAIGDGDGSEPAVRVRVLNLVAVAFDDGRADQVAAVVEEVAGCHPNRSLIVQVSEDAPRGDVEASISASCAVAADGRQLCGEEVLLRGHPDDTHSMASAVASLLVPDLPTVLWWPPGLPSDHLYEDLSELADRLILDSATLAPSAATFGVMDALTRASRPTAADLNWARLLPCRALTAQFFDNPSYRPYLETVNRLEIEGNGPSTQPMLFLGWLASRLDWSPVDARLGGAATQIVLASGLRPVEATLRVTGDGPGRLAALGLGSDQPGRSLFEILCLTDSECGTVRAEIEGAEVEHRSVQLAPTPEGELLCHELEQVGREPVFEEALATALQLAQLIEGE